MCLKKIVSKLIQKHVSTKLLLHLAFSCNDKKKLKITIIWFTIKYMFSLYHSPNSDSKKILLMIKYDMSMLNGNKYVDQLLDITRNSFEEILFALESTSLTFGGKRLYFSANAFFFVRKRYFFVRRRRILV